MTITLLHQLTQEVITAIKEKQPKLAKEKIATATDYLQSLMDVTTNDAELIELSKYEALIHVLNNKLK